MDFILGRAPAQSESVKPSSCGAIFPNAKRCRHTSSNARAVFLPGDDCVCWSCKLKKIGIHEGDEVPRGETPRKLVGNLPKLVFYNMLDGFVQRMSNVSWEIDKCSSRWKVCGVTELMPKVCSLISRVCALICMSDPELLEHAAKLCSFIVGLCFLIWENVRLSFLEEDKIILEKSVEVNVKVMFGKLGRVNVAMLRELAPIVITTSRKVCVDHF